MGKAQNGLPSVARQWGIGETKTDGTQKVTLPISASVLIGLVSDRGTSPVFYSFNDRQLMVYGRAPSGSLCLGAFSYIVVCY